MRALRWSVLIPAASLLLCLAAGAAAEEKEATSVSDGTPGPSSTATGSSWMAKMRRPEPKALASSFATRAISATGEKQVNASMVAMGNWAAGNWPCDTI